MGREAFLSAMQLHFAGQHLDAVPGGSIEGGTRRAKRDAFMPDVSDQAIQDSLAEAPCARSERRRLFTSTLVDLEGETTLHVFHATMAPNHAIVQSLLAARYGFKLARLARTMQGSIQAIRLLWRW
jgi:hypothetical protein